ncbi:P-loop NTPase [Marinomonas gallaica]|uniref:P-loop NTPase n=1 Tax=Marinomonas gallaica TaxID=1806667 RepID=UPI0009EEC432|nr:SIR2 family protein [Marinomonas gallaica]
MNSHIKQALLNGRLVLLFGAGASRGSLNGKKEEIPMAWDLAKIFSEACGYSAYNDESLSEAYGAARSKLGSQVDNIFEENFKHCTPSNEFNEIAKYPFLRVYTLNIDDAFEKSLYLHSKRKFYIRLRGDKVCDPDQLFESMDYIKLNGDVNRIADGFIFSSQEYAQASGNPPLWYEELADDYLKYTFLFIGTRLDEPLFKHQVERYKGKTNSSEQRSYLLIPSLTEMQVDNFAASNLEHIPGTLKDFVDWLKLEFQNIPDNIDLLKNSKPHLIINEKGGVNKLYDGIFPVYKGNISVQADPEKTYPIKSFYKGYKPSWHDIYNEIPAYLKSFRDFYNLIFENEFQLYVVKGAAGSGKTTLLKQVALRLSDSNAVYFLDAYSGDLKSLVEDLSSKIDSTFYIFIERLGDFSYEVSNIIKQGSSKVVFVSAENLGIYSSRVKEYFHGINVGELHLQNIDSKDADPILEKIKQYGNWTRLEKMSLKNRRIELLKRAKSQLLIGLLEATSGEGFNEIIKKDYQRIESKSERYLLLLSGLATTQGVNASEVTITRALGYLGVDQNIYEMSKRMEGIIKYSNGYIQTRHKVYIERILDMYVSKEEIYDILKAYIEAFSVYDVPIVPSLKGKSQEAKIYKHLVNAKALRKLLGKDEFLICSLYKNFEKVFESDGLFLMQYGLALRSFGKQREAYEKLRIAFDAYDSAHVEHALAQQRIIMALEEDEEIIAESYFKMAEESLRKLDRSDIKVFDRYPIIALSEGHIQYLHKFGRAQKAKIFAKSYYEEMNKKSIDSPRINQAKDKMMKYYLHGKWSFQDYSSVD